LVQVYRQSKSLSHWQQSTSEIREPTEDEAKVLPDGALIHSCSTEPGDSGIAVVNASSRKFLGTHAGSLSTGDGKKFNYFFPVPVLDPDCGVMLARKTQLRDLNLDSEEIEASYGEEAASFLKAKIRQESDAAKGKVMTTGTMTRSDFKNMYNVSQKLGKSLEDTFGYDFAVNYQEDPVFKESFDSALDQGYSMHDATRMAKREARESKSSTKRSHGGGVMKGGKGKGGKHTYEKANTSVNAPEMVIKKVTYEVFTESSKNLPWAVIRPEKMDQTQAPALKISEGSLEVKKNLGDMMPSHHILAFLLTPRLPNSKAPSFEWANKGPSFRRRRKTALSSVRSQIKSQNLQVSSGVELLMKHRMFQSSFVLTRTEAC